jgi:hypothetical protein
MLTDFRSRWEDYEDSHSCFFLAGIFGGAGLGALLGGGISAIGSVTAASEQAAAQQNALNFQQGVYSQSQSELAPYYSAGTSALSSLVGGVGTANAPGNLTQTPQAFGAATGTPVGSAPQYSLPDFTLQQFQQSPGYQFQLQQGVNAIQNAAGPKTGVLSGNTLQALQTYGTGLANQDWYNWLTNQQNNYNTAFQAQNQSYLQNYGIANQNQSNLYNRLLGLATGGQQAATLTGPQSSLANTIGNTASSIGSSNAAGILGATGGVSNALTGASNANQYSALIQALNGSGSSASPYSLAYAAGSGAGSNPGVGTGGLY